MFSILKQTTYLKKEHVVRARPRVVVQGEVVVEAMLEGGGGGHLKSIFLFSFFFLSFYLSWVKIGDLEGGS